MQTSILHIYILVMELLTAVARLSFHALQSRYYPRLSMLSLSVVASNVDSHSREHGAVLPF